MEGGVVVVGAGQAAAQLCLSLRRSGFTGPLTVIGDEPHLPYQRPPLSKLYLKGETTPERLPFRPAAFYEDQGVALRLGVRAAALDPGRQLVVTEEGGSLPYDRLVLATGSRPRRLAGAGATQTDGLHYLRSIDDADALRAAMTGGEPAVVLGGGYIGLEFAAVARTLGHDVTVVEREPRLLGRVTSEAVAAYFLRLHEDRGVAFRLGATVERVLTAAGERVSGVRLGDGAALPCRLLLVGIGGIANDELAREAGIECHPGGGVLTGADGATSLPNVYAAGDCARRALEGFDEPVRVESVQNAIDQADRIAAAISGKAARASDPPWFWSDQYEVKLQTVGVRHEADEAVLRGDSSTAPFTVAYFRSGRLAAADCVGDPAGFMTLKQVLKSGGQLSREEVADPSMPWKALMARARR